MRTLCAAAVCAMLIVGPALAEPMEAGDPLAPCLKGHKPPDDALTSGSGWAVEIASSFNKQESLDDFSEAQKAYSDVLGDFSPHRGRGARSQHGHRSALFRPRRI